MCSECLFLLLNAEEFALPVHLEWDHLGLLTEQVLLEYRGEFWFLLVSWISCNVLFNISLRDHSGGIHQYMNVSGDVCDDVVSRSLMSMPAAFLSKLTSVKMNKHLRGVNAFCVSF